MIVVNGHTYPSEVRTSQKVELEDQAIPAGSSSFPGLSEELAIGRSLIAGAVIENGAFAADLEDFKSNLPHAANEGETYDGSLADPSGSGAPIHKPSTPTPQLQAESLPLTPEETKAAQVLLEELKTDFPKANVLRFVRYPDDRRILLVFTDGDEPQQLQQKY